MLLCFFCLPVPLFSNYNYFLPKREQFSSVDFIGGLYRQMRMCTFAIALKIQIILHVFGARVVIAHRVLFGFLTLKLSGKISSFILFLYFSYRYV